MERADDEENPAPPGQQPNALGVGPDELQALAQLLAGKREPPAKAPDPRPLKRVDEEQAWAQGDVIAGRFEVLRSLKKGARGLRLLAREIEQPDSRVVIEVLRPEVGAQVKDLDGRLEELIERLRAFPADSLYALHASGRIAEGRLFLVSSAPRGTSLGVFITRSGALRPEHALEIARQVLTVLSQGHRRKLAHGALDADAVLLEERVPRTQSNPFGVGLRLVDFGLAGLFDAGQGEFAGSDDLCCVGALLISMLLGQTTESSAQQDSLPLPVDLAPQTLRLIERAMGWGGAPTFVDADAMLRAIEACADWKPREQQPQSKIAWWVAGFALVGLAISLVFRPRATQAEQKSPEIVPAGISQALYQESEEALIEAQDQIERVLARTGQLERDNARLNIESQALRAERDSLRSRLDAALEQAPERTEEVRTLPDPTAQLDTLLGAALEAPLALGPQDVRELARTSSDEDLARALARFRETALPLLLGKEGDVLNRERLGAIPALTAWSEVARAKDLDGQVPRLELARHYFDRVEPLGVPTDEQIEWMRGQVDAADLPAWQRQLILSMELEAEPGALSGPPDARALWMTRDAGGEIAWVWRVSKPLDEPAEGVLRAWKIEEARYDAEGNPTDSASFRIVQSGRGFAEVDGDQLKLLADLASNSLGIEALAQPLAHGGESLPESLGITAEEVAYFAGALVGRSALVRRAGTREWWFVPGLGLVRQIDEDGSLRELIFVQGP